MNTLNISATPRQEIGRTNANELRKAGKVPCVLYGGKEILHFEATAKIFKPLIFTPDVHLVKLDVNGKQADAVLKDIQYHPVTDQIMHIDFLEVTQDKPVELALPVRFKGTPVGVKEGGQMLKKLTRVKAKGLISKIPGFIELDVEPMKIGDYIRVRDLKIDGITFMHEPSVTIVAVKATRVVVEETPVAAEGAEGAATAEGAAEGDKPVAEGDKPAEGAKKEEKKEEKKK